jgi:excisionase family DNA binding protein
MTVYTPKSLAEHWQCDDAVIYRLIAKGELQAFRLGGKLWRIRGDAVEAYEKCRTIGSAGSRGSSLSSGRNPADAAAIASARAIRERREPRCWNLSDAEMKVPFRQGRE